MEECSPSHCPPGEPVGVSDLRQYSEKSDAEYLDSLSDYVSTNRYKILTLGSPTNAVLRIANLDDTIYKERLDEVNGWGKFYLPKIVKMQVLGVVEGTSCPCDQLVLMTCEDKKLYAYDGEDLHLVASSVTCLCDKGIEYPASMRYYNGEAFKDMTNEDWEKVREGDVGKKLDEEHKKLVMEKKPRLMQNLAASRKKHKSVTKLKMDLGSASVSKMKMHLGSASASDWSLRSASDKLRDVRKEFVDNVTWSQFYQLVRDFRDFGVMEPYHRFRRFEMRIGRRNEGAARIFHIMKCHGNEKMKTRLKSKYPELYSSLFTDEPSTSVDIKFAENVSQSQLDWIINELEDHGVLKHGEGYKILEERRRRGEAKDLIDTVIQCGDIASEEMMTRLKSKCPKLYSSLFTDKPSSSSVSKMKMHLGSASASDWSLRSASDKLRDVRKEFVDNVTWSDIHQLVRDFRDFGVMEPYHRFRRFGMRIGRRNEGAARIFHIMKCHGNEKMKTRLKSKYPELYSSLFTDEPSTSENVSQSQLDWIINELEDHGVLKHGEGYKILEERRRRDEAKDLIDTVIQRGDIASEEMMTHLKSKCPKLYSSLFTDKPSSSKE